MKRAEPQCLDGYGWADFHDCTLAIEMLSNEIPVGFGGSQNLLGEPEKFEFLGVGATPRFPGYRSIETPLKKTSGQLKSVTTSIVAYLIIYS